MRDKETTIHQTNKQSKSKQIFAINCKRKKNVSKQKAFYGVVVVAFCVVSLAVGAFGDSVFFREKKLTNTVQMSVVDLAITTSTTGNREDALKNIKVVPGEVVPIQPKIENRGADCYVRLRVSSKLNPKLDTDFAANPKSDFRAKLEETADSDFIFCTDSVTGLSDDWIHTGDYLYFTKPLRHGDERIVFEGCKMPQGLGNEYAGCTFQVLLEAQAIQSDYFTPDFSAENPWGTENITECPKTEYVYNELPAYKNVSCSVTYVGGAQQFIMIPEDFFIALGAMVPSGAYQESVEIKNTSDQEAELFLRMDGEQNQGSLLKKIRLKIVKKEENGMTQTIYEGACKPSEVQEYISLGHYQKDECCLLELEINVPAQLDNAYALQMEKIDWIFKAVTQKNTMPEKTGDRFDVIKYVLLVIASGGIIALLYKNRKKDVQEK